MDGPDLHNQADLDERAQQVGLMFNIFSKASCVLMWLGPDPENLASVANDFVVYTGRNVERPLKDDLRFPQMLEEWEIPKPESIE